ncbi:MAG: thiamine-phosphate kinase [Bacteriovorax sp.]
MNKKKNLNDVNENEILSLWGTIFSRNPDQINSIHQSDSELVSFFPQGDDLLAVSVDTVEEEIALGFYDSPESIGFASVMASVSDLAAVGAGPIGIVCSLSLTNEYRDETMRRRLASGIERACKQLGTFVLGGDTNWSDRLAITITAMGRTTKKQAKLRTPMEEGDHLYSTGLFALGSVRAALKILNIKNEKLNSEYYPIARIKEGLFLSQYASAMMDTSDGLMSALDQLSRLNHCGFKLSLSAVDLIRPDLRPIVKELNFPALAFLASEVGEYELLFTVKAIDHDRFVRDSQMNGVQFFNLGKVISETEIYCADGKIDTLKFRQLYSERDLSTEELMKQLIKLCKQKTDS